MTHRQFTDLVALTEARFRTQEARLKEVAAEEKALRERIRALEAQHAKAQNVHHADPAGQGRYGGDILWQGYVARSRRDLQISLAQVLARKGQIMKDLQEAHGRKLSAEDLERNNRISTRTKAQNRTTEQERALMLVRAARRGHT